MFLSKYGVARHIYVPIIKRAVVDFAVGADWTPAAGDVKISKDGGAAANVTNLPTAIVMGNTAMWDFSLTATEMQAALIKVTVADSATKAVEDQMFAIETYGNASAQHAFDLDTASTAQTGDSFARLGAPNGASHAADVAAVKTDTAAILDDTGTAGVVVAAASKTGYALSAAGVQAIWDALTAALTAVGSIGKLLVDNINATISSRLATAGYTAPLDAAGTRAAVGLAAANLDTQLGAILADTNELQTDWANGGRLDLILDARASQASVDTVDTVADAIKAKTDSLNFTVAGVLNVNALYVNGVQVQGTGVLGDEWRPV